MIEGIGPLRALQGRVLTDDELRVAHAAAADPARPRSERRRARLTLRRRAERDRARGLSDTESLACQLFRALGSRTARHGRPTLARLGLSALLEPRIKHLDTLDQFLEAAGKDLGEITAADVDAFAGAARCRSSVVKRRSDLRTCFGVMIELDLVAENPSPLALRPKATPLSPEGEKFEEFLKACGFLPSSRESSLLARAKV